MKKKLLFPLIAAFLLVPWPIAYAFDSANASNATVTITPADASVAPHIQAFGLAIGSVEPGELFTVDTSGAGVDKQFSLCITNTDEMVACYRYMTLNIGIYVRTNDGNWNKVTTAGGAVPDIYLTIQDGIVSFTLPADAFYKITIDKGCFYCYGNDKNGYIAAPDFNLTVD